MAFFTASHENLPKPFVYSDRHEAKYTTYSDVSDQSCSEIFYYDATGEGIFLRKFVSSEEGCDWFKLTDAGALEKWEDASAVPSVLPASKIEYGEFYRREWYLEEPVTFDRQTGRVITLEELLNLSEQEITSKLTASIYKYMECVWRGDFFLTTNDILTEKYHTDQFFLFSEGIGLYYRRDTIDCSAAGDFVFIIPWDEVK